MYASGGLTLPSRGLASFRQLEIYMLSHPSHHAAHNLLPWILSDHRSRIPVGEFTTQYGNMVNGAGIYMRLGNRKLRAPTRSY